MVPAIRIGRNAPSTNRAPEGALAWVPGKETPQLGRRTLLNLRAAAACAASIASSASTTAISALSSASAGLGRQQFFGE